MWKHCLVAVALLGSTPTVADPAAKPAPKLSITGMAPATGDPEGDTYVRITGTRFIADGARSAKVYFGSRQGTIVRFSSDTEMIAQAPGGKDGDAVDVRVIFDPGGEIKVPTKFTYAAKKR